MTYQKKSPFQTFSKQAPICFYGICKISFTLKYVFLVATFRQAFLAFKDCHKDQNTEMCVSEEYSFASSKIKHFPKTPKLSSKIIIVVDSSKTLIEGHLSLTVKSVIYKNAVWWRSKNVSGKAMKRVYVDNLRVSCYFRSFLEALTWALKFVQNNEVKYCLRWW